MGRTDWDRVLSVGYNSPNSLSLLHHNGHGLDADLHILFAHNNIRQRNATVVKLEARVLVFPLMSFPRVFQNSDGLVN